MLNKINFVQESIDINLYYLRTLREFCLNIQESLPPKDITYRNEAENIALSCESIGEELVKYADGRISQMAIDLQIYVTNYTLECEKLTEKLFGTNINTSITEKELSLNAGNIDSVSIELEQAIENINNESLNLTNRFIELSKIIYNKMIKNDIFSYSYPTMFQYMIYDAELFKAQLERLIRRNPLDPTYAINSEFYFNNSMKTICTFINKLIDQNNEELMKEAKNFFNLFEIAGKKYTNTILSPENQIILTNEEINLVEQFRKFLEECIKKTLAAEAYFIIEPIFLDNMYTQANYFLYILYKNQQSH